MNGFRQIGLYAARTHGSLREFRQKTFKRSYSFYLELTMFQFTRERGKRMRKCKRAKENENFSIS